MRRAVTIQDEVTQIETIENLTGVFESIASLKISKVRHRVVASKEFFAELWQTYSQLRVDHSERIGQRKATENGKQARTRICWLAFLTLLRLRLRPRSKFPNLTQVQ